jgi:hypothetical protein
MATFLFYREWFMRIFIIFLLPILFSSHALAFSIKYNDKFPGNFRITCKTWGWGLNKISARTDFVWDLNSKRLIITGDGIADDGGRLIESEGPLYSRTIKVATTYSKAIPEYKRPNIKDLYMTFREEDTRANPKHSFVRTFYFQIRDGEYGHVIATDIFEVNGIFDVQRYGMLDECSCTGIYATP